VRDNDIFEKEMSGMMNYSNYPKEHYLYDESKKAQLGYFKDEIQGDSKITEFVWLCFENKRQ